MAVTPLAWQLTIGLIVGLLLVDYFFHVRKAHVPTLKEAALWTAAYVGIALLFGVAVLVYGGAEAGAEYFAGYVTEKALSVDNVFVFLFILTRFKVPRQDQQKALLFGIVLSMIVRTAFILLGAALIESFAWVFYLFGLLLLVTAGQLFRPETVDGEKRGRLRRPHGPQAVPDHRLLRRRPDVHHPRRQAHADPDAAGDGLPRLHRPAVRDGLHSGHLRPHPGRVHRVHRDRVLPCWGCASCSS